MDRTLHLKSAVEKLALPRNQGGKGITNLRWLNNNQFTNIQKYFHRRKSESTLHNAVIKADTGLTTVKLQHYSNEETVIKRRQVYNNEL